MKLKDIQKDLPATQVDRLITMVKDDEDLPVRDGIAMAIEDILGIEEGTPEFESAFKQVMDAYKAKYLTKSKKK